MIFHKHRIKIIFFKIIECLKLKPWFKRKLRIEKLIAMRVWREFFIRFLQYQKWAN